MNENSWYYKDNFVFRYPIKYLPDANIGFCYMVDLSTFTSDTTEIIVMYNPDKSRMPWSFTLVQMCSIQNIQNVLRDIVLHARSFWGLEDHQYIVEFYPRFLNIPTGIIETSEDDSELPR